MRYGLQLVPKGAFPQDVELGIRLQDEPVIPVPEECPDCPPAVGCEVECYGVDIYVISGGACTSARRYSSATYTLAAGAFVVIAPAGEWCGHRTRFLVDEGTLSGHTITTTSGLDGEKSIALELGSSGSGTFQFQIDLTDAEPGGETWTDQCFVVTVGAAPEG